MVTPVNDPIRVPFVGSYNTRIFTVGNSSSSAIVGITIVGVGIVGSSTASTGITKDQRFVNAILETIKNPNSSSPLKYYVYKRPGVSTNTTPASGNIGTAVKVWTGSANEIMSAFGATNSTLYKDTTSLGAVTGLINHITETVVGTTPNIVVSTDGNKAYYYPSGGALTEITDVDFPGKAGKTIIGQFVHMDGYAFIMCTDGTIYNSDLGSVSAWTSSSFISANMYPDKGIGLSRYKDMIVAFGKESIEFFKDVGNAVGSPLQHVPEATIRTGAISDTAMCSLEDNLAWVAGSDTGTFSVYILDGYQPVRISDNVIDTQLAQRGDTAVHMTSGKFNGKTLIFLIFNEKTWVCDVESKLWTEWSNTTHPLWYQLASSSAASSAIYAISRTSTSGKVYIFNLVTPVFQDDSTNYVFTIQTSKFDLDTENLKVGDRLTVVGDTTSASTNLSISWSDDDYNTWSTARTVDMSSNRKYLNNIGTFRRRAFKLTETSSNPIRLEALEFNIRKRLH